MNSSILLGKYFTLEDFCTCSKTYQKYTELIDPYPKNSEETVAALQALNYFILDPIIDYFGFEKFQLTYGFCSASLKRYFNQKDPVTGMKNGRVDPSRDQHIAHEMNRKGEYYCKRLGAACDFIIKNQQTNQVIEWILQAKLPFDSLYFYGNDRPLHISYGPQQKREIWTFTKAGMPTKKGIETWIALAKSS